MKKMQVLVDAAIVASIFLVVSMMGYTFHQSQDQYSKLYPYRFLIQICLGALIGLGTLIVHTYVSYWRNRALPFSFKVVTGEINFQNIARGSGRVFGEGCVIGRLESIDEVVQSVADNFISGDCDYVAVEDETGSMFLLANIEEHLIGPAFPENGVKRGKVIHLVDAKLFESNVGDLTHVDVSA